MAMMPSVATVVHTAFVRQGTYAALASTALALLLLAIRGIGTGTTSYFFLAWNLFLAWVPYGCAVAWGESPHASRAVRAALALLWLAFFPNAPYLITDLMHFRYQITFAWWYDVGMLATFVWTGLWLGLASLRIFHRQVAVRRGSVAGWGFVAAVALLSGLGITVGRFLRWNSWDLLTNPWGLMTDLIRQLRFPGDDGPPWLGATLLYAVALVACYLPSAGDHLRGGDPSA